MNSDITGKKFNRLVAIEKIDSKYWRFICDCGKEHVARKDHVVGGATRSCGCWRKDFSNQRTHGMARTRFYKIYSGMKARCLLKTNPKYHRYGGRGISLSSSWIDFDNFKNDMYDSYLLHSEKYGEKNTTIDRIDNNGNYCKENCRWSTWKDQSNNKGNLLEYNGRLMNVASIARETGINRGSISRRLQRGLSINQIILMIVKKSNKT